MSTVTLNTNQKWTVYVIDCDQRLGVPYFGMTGQLLKNRFSKHKADLNRRLHPNKMLQQLCDQYGIKSLKIREIATFDNQIQAAVLEETLIKTWIDHRLVGWEVCNLPTTRAGRAKKTYQWKGNIYNGLSELSVATGMSPSHICNTLKKNKSIFNEPVLVLPPKQVVRASASGSNPSTPYVAGRKSKVKVEWNSKIYNSIQELAIAAGTTTGTISNAMRRSFNLFGYPVKKVV